MDIVLMCAAAVLSGARPDDASFLRTYLEQPPATAVVAAPVAPLPESGQVVARSAEGWRVDPGAVIGGESRGCLYCPAKACWGQNADDPYEAHTVYTSDLSLGPVVAEDFAAPDCTEICDVHWWGLILHWDSGWYDCPDPNGMEFEITFWEPGPEPANVVCSYVVTPIITDLGLSSGVASWYHFEAPQLAPCCPINEGWVTIQSVQSPEDCAFLWMSECGGVGNSQSLQWIDGCWIELGIDQGVCFTEGDAGEVDCPPNSLFAQLPEPAEGPWALGLSDYRPNEIIYDEFTIPYGMRSCGVHWWGTHLRWNGGGWEPCLEEPATFEISFYWEDPNAPGQPGEGGCDYEVMVTPTPTAYTYNGWPLYAYSTDLDQCCVLESGWMSVVGNGSDPNCYFFWLSGRDGNGSSWVKHADGMEEAQGYDLSVCLTPGYWGACCLEHVSGTARCQVLPWQDCQDLGGDYQGDNATCGAPLGNPHHYESLPAVTIPDDDSDGITDQIDVWESCEVGDVDVDVCISHPRISDLVIMLTHWDVSVVLWNGACGNSDSMGVIFDDEGSAVLCTSPAVGNIDPVSANGRPLSAFDGLEAEGAWVLTVVDQVSGEVGRLSHWSLHIDFLEDNPCVEPRGACCLDPNCQVLTWADCYEQGGVYLGDFTLCELVSCPCEPEGEPICYAGYVDTYNGGCDSEPPVFQPIACGEEVCGTSGNFLADPNTFSPWRDSDWYEVEVSEGTQLTWTVQAEFRVVATIYPGHQDPNEDCPVDNAIASGWAMPGRVANVSAPVRAGRYLLYVAPKFKKGVPCGSQYVGRLTCEPCGACCMPDGTCQMLTAEGCYAHQHARWLGAFSSCSDTPYPCAPLGACCVPAPVGGTQWCRVLTEQECADYPGGGVWGGTMYADCGYPDDEVQVWEASPMLAIPGGNPNGIAHTIYVEQSGEVGDVDIDVDIEHTRLSDLVITVEHYGVEAVLWDGACSGDEDVSVNFDDEGGAVFCASPALGSITARSANGDRLSKFDGLEVSGDWTLHVVDQVAGEAGTLRHWSVDIRFLMDNPCAPGLSGACCLPDNACVVTTQVDCCALLGEFQGVDVQCVPSPCCEGQARGDCNGDGSINALDIDKFAQALVDREQYNIDYAPFRWECTVDINCDGSANGLDTAPFVECLISGCPPCPG